MEEATRPSGLASLLEVEKAAVVDRLRSTGALSVQSFPRVIDVISRFCSFSQQAFGVESLASTSADVAAAFVHARTANGDPALATMHLRRSTLRLLFRTARQLELTESDPTLDLFLPARSATRTRPLSDEEVALCRAASLDTLTSTRLSAAWALAEASARSAELGHICVGDLDLSRCRVRLHGSSRTVERWVPISGWGLSQLERRMRDIGGDARRPVVYSGSRSSDYHRQASSCVAIGDVLTRAGLAGEPDIRPSSAAAWAGQQLLAQTGRIDVVASRLGIRSLDRAARLISWDWQDPETGLIDGR
jgi:site-specific recombinase XerD